MITCRRLAPNDAIAHATLRRQGLAEAPSDFGEDLDELDAITPETWRDRLEARPESAVVFGAFDEEALVGVAGLYRRIDRRKLWHRAELFGTYVSPPARRRGVGSLLLQELLAFARHVPGLERIGLGVRASNVAARALYEKMGWVAWGIEPCGLRAADHTHDLVHMDRELVAARTHPPC